MEGIDLVILCFGSSGTGKTYSTFGLYNRYEYRGIAPRLLEQLFKLKEVHTSTIKMDILLTYVEIIGKNIHNLLMKNKPIISKTGSKAYNGLLAVHLENVCHGMKLMFDGDQRRNFENENSHCGTSIVTFEIISISLIKDNPINISAKIHIIDTAGTDYGSNPIKSMKCHVDANLTKCSLNTLCSWLSCDADDKAVACRRESILALYLGYSLLKGFTRFIGHIKTTNEDLPNSMSTLLFGTRLRKLPSPLLVQARTRNADLIIKSLQEQINEMKECVVQENILKGVFVPETISNEQMKYVTREIKYFILSPTNDTGLLSVAHPTILLNGLKHLYLRDMQELKQNYDKQIEDKEAAIALEREKWIASTRDKKPPTSAYPIKQHKRLVSTKTILTPSKTPSRSNSPPVSENEQKPTVEVEYDFSKLELENECQGEENYAKTFSEFLARSPQLAGKIAHYENDITENFQVKCELQSQLTQLSYEINSLRMELQKEEWKTFNKTLETKGFDHEGRIFKKSQEQTQLEEDINTKIENFNLLRASLLYAHNKYIAATVYLNETKLNTEKLYNDYVKHMYSNTLLLRPQEMKVTVNGDEEVNESKDYRSKITEESKKCFNKLQGKPLKRKKWK